VEKEDCHKEEDIFAIHLSDEETEDFAKEEKPVQEIQEKEMEKGACL